MDDQTKAAVWAQLTQCVYTLNRMIQEVPGLTTTDKARLTGIITQLQSMATGIKPANIAFRPPSLPRWHVPEFTRDERGDRPK